MQAPIDLDVPNSAAQAEILASGLIHTGFNCILQMPTGSGKTWLAEQAIAAAIRNGARAIYLTPLRALASELVARWHTRFAPTKVGIFTGDYGVTGKPYPVPFRDAQVLIMTPERLDACTRAWRSHWSWIPEVDVLVVDEFHLLGDRHRGARLEGAISRLRRLNPFLYILGLSATLGNRHELAEWLEGVEYQSNWRPIPIQWRIARYRRASEKPALLVEEVKRNTSAGGKSLVFVQSRRRAEELSRYLQTHGLRSHHHHAGLPHEERRKIEADFRNITIDVLIATSTLEMGLNLPTRQVVLYDVQAFDGIDFQPLSTNSVWQRIGRAGRPGFDTQGEAVLLAPVWDHNVNYYEQERFEPICSGLADSHALAEQIIAEVTSGLARTPLQIKRVLNQSLAAHQQILPDVYAAIIEMCNAGMLKQSPADESGEVPQGTFYLQATRLGHVASRHLLTPATMLLFKRVMDSEQALTFFDLLIMATCSDDCEPLLPVNFEELDALNVLLAREHSLLLQRSQCQVIQLLGVRGKRLLSALKMALVIRDWTHRSDTSTVAEEYDCYPFEVERLAESLERLLLAMSGIVECKDDRQEEPGISERFVPLSERIQALRRMVASGLDECAVTLTLVDGIGPKLAKKFQTIGIQDIEDLAMAEPGDLRQLPGMSHKRATRWIEAAQSLIRSKSAFYFKETGPAVHLASSGWPDDVDPYRLRRALDLKIAGVDGGRYLVTGGLEPHIVQIDRHSLSCDCLDASKGYQCKHVLAVQFHKGDRKLRELARQLGSAHHEKLDLFSLWFDGRISTRSRSAS